MRAALLEIAMKQGCTRAHLHARHTRWLSMRATITAVGYEFEEAGIATVPCSSRLSRRGMWTEFPRKLKAVIGGAHERTAWTEAPLRESHTPINGDEHYCRRTRP